MSTLIVILLLTGSSIMYGNDFSKKNYENFILNRYSMDVSSREATDVKQYGAKIADLVYRSDWDAIVKEIYPINLPDGWQEKAKPTFEDFFGIKLSVEVIAFEELPEFQLHWLKMAPEAVLNKTRQAIRLSYDHSKGDEIDKGNLELAIYQHDGTFSILMVGGR